MAFPAVEGVRAGPCLGHERISGWGRVTSPPGPRDEAFRRLDRRRHEHMFPSRLGRIDGPPEIRTRIATLKRRAL